MRKLDQPSIFSKYHLEEKKKCCSNIIWFPRSAIPFTCSQSSSCKSSSVQVTPAAKCQSVSFHTSAGMHCKAITREKLPAAARSRHTVYITYSIYVDFSHLYLQNKRLTFSCIIQKPVYPCTSNSLQVKSTTVSPFAIPFLFLPSYPLYPLPGISLCIHRRHRTRSQRG